MLNNGVNLWRLLLRRGGGYPLLNLVQLLDKVSDTEFIDSIDGNNATIKGSNCLTFDGVDDVLTFSAGYLTGKTITSSLGTGTPTINGDTIECTAGTLYRLELSNGEIFPLAEGSGSKVYSDLGTVATVTNATLSTFWGERQDVFHNNLLNGFQTIGDIIDLRIPLKTDGSPIYTDDNIFEIKMRDGLMDFSWDGDFDFWIFEDGTISTDARPAKTLATYQSCYLVSRDWSGDFTLNDNDTSSKYIGTLSDLPPLTYFLNLNRSTLVTGDLSDLPPLTHGLDIYYNKKITGDFSDLPALTYYLNLDSCIKITGDLSDLPALTNYLNLRNTIGITGDLSDLPPLTYYLKIYNCTNVVGIIPTTVTAYVIYLNGSGLSKTDIEQSLINIDSVAIPTAPAGANFTCTTGMPTITDPTAIAAAASLRAKGWIVNINE